MAEARTGHQPQPTVETNPNQSYQIPIGGLNPNREMHTNRETSGLLNSVVISEITRATSRQGHAIFCHLC
jgi:hypothetical protein